MKNQISNSAFSNFAHLYSIFIALLFFSILSLFQICFIFDINHLNLILPLSGLFSVVITNLLIDTPRKFNLWCIIGLILILAGIYSFWLFDKAGDGRWYHQETIILIKNGWNPILNSFFINNMPPSDFVQSKTFAIANELLNSSFAIFFKHIQIGKIINLLFALQCFCIAFISLEKLFQQNLKSNLIISGYIVLNPIVLSQLQSFYLDGNLFLCFTICLFAILMWLYHDENKLFWTIILAINFAILANIKMTGLIYGCIIMFISFLVYFINHKQKIPKFSLRLFFILLSGFIFLGWHPYIQNLIAKRNIFWPILGTNHLNVFVDVTKGVSLAKPLLFIMSYLTPFPMEETKLFIPVLKPFVRTDTFIGALGPFFGIIFLTGIYFSIKYCYNNFYQIKNNITTQIITTILMVIFICVFINPAPWWTKYSPVIVLIPALGFIIISLTKPKVWSQYSWIFVIMIFINSGLFYGGSLLLTGYRSYKLYQMERICRLHQCIFDIGPHKVFYTSLTNQLKEDNVNIENIGSCNNKNIIWHDIIENGNETNMVCQ